MSRVGWVDPSILVALVALVAPGVALALGACGPTDDAPPVPVDAGSEGSSAAPSDASPPAKVDASACASKRAQADGGCDPLVFISGALVAGDLGGGTGRGVDRADAICQAAGATRYSGKTFRAWLSGGGVNARDRLEHSTRPYRNQDGDIVATSWDKLASPSHTLQIDLTEDGTHVRTIGTFAYTGTKPSGEEDIGLTCNDWTTANSSAQGQSGVPADVTIGEWTAERPIPCDTLGRLYCIEQAP